MHAGRGSNAWSWNLNAWIKCHIGNEDEKAYVLQSESMEEHVKSLEILQVTCMHEEEQVLEVVAMEERKVEILTPEQDATKEDEDEKGHMLQSKLVEEHVKSPKIHE